jgi:Tfp pilus assembly protein PilE
MQKQRGMTFIGTVLTVAGIVFIAVVAMKIWPAYSEYFALKRAFASLKSQIESNENITPKEIKDAFDRQQAIDDFKSVQGKDLVINVDNGHTVVSVEYSAVEPIMGNVSALVDFKLSTDDKSLKAH